MQFTGTCGRLVKRLSCLTSCGSTWDSDQAELMFDGTNNASDAKKQVPLLG